MFCITSTFTSPVHSSRAGGSVYACKLRRKSLRKHVLTQPWPQTLRLCAAGSVGDDSASESGVEPGMPPEKAQVTSSATDPELERLRLAVERAKLEAERARLQAEKARLEAEKAKIEAEKQRLAKEKEKEKAALAAKGTAAVASGIAQPAANTDATAGAQQSGTRSPTNDAGGKQPERGSAPLNNTDPALRRAIESGMLDERSMALLSQMGSFVLGGGISDDDLKLLQEKVLTFDTFMANQITRTPIGVVIRGRLRVQNPSEAYQRLEMALANTGLNQRLRLFLMEDPRSPFLTDDELLVDSADESARLRSPPIIVVMPITSEPAGIGIWQYLLASVLGVTALFTTFGYGVGVFGLSPDFAQQIARGNIDVVSETLPVSIGAVGILVAHELGHRIAGAVRGVKQGLSFVIPSLQIGYYGCVTPLKSFPRNRSSLFDVAVAGPVAGLVSSVVALLAGLVLTVQQGSTPLDWFPQIPSALFDASLFIGTLGKAILPQSALSQPTIAVHPLFVVGYTGLLSQALQLLPIGRTDGGRMVQAAFGRRIAGRVSGITLLLQALASVLGNSPLLLFYGLVVIFLQREQELPCLDEVSEPDNARRVTTFVLLLITMLILLPFPSQFGDITGQF
ncbi:hypothetical protein, conserved [Cyanidioschyzon merolae strain 10D]|uniref:Peptidase M50 domain-containing protein n=1 Tax=Cyanidioschyzon merolae (strain NIES-3377 / 10D) TaxID=280699 RepID=M1V684_CYAM1|nr:hypothetical protein, conserved [Cyanidioschyzon merolae strain 10D]BAM81950.1 hypothetical protein, conserved [Cyanidioschyzon merolae strain 10D]|eukprot:XP_005537986.1 hypothetical protein, conserved [Cyanidioschyzon merolae strain 10D]